MLSEYFGGKALNRRVNPDEAVAIGATIQACILSGAQRLPGITVEDVIPLSIGMLVTGDEVEPIIHKNTTIPCSEIKTFWTASKNQTYLDIVVYQGESTVRSECIEIAKTRLNNIPKNKSGAETIDVTYSITKNGILEITAKATSEANSVVTLTVDMEKMGLDIGEIDD